MSHFVYTFCGKNTSKILIFIYNLPIKLTICLAHVYKTLFPFYRVTLGRIIWVVNCRYLLHILTHKHPYFVPPPTPRRNWLRSKRTSALTSTLVLGSLLACNLEQIWGIVSHVLCGC